MTHEDGDPVSEFAREREERIATNAADTEWRRTSEQWLRRAFERRYMYNFTWMGRPIIQMPQDMVAVQELIWQTRPGLIIETGIAHGGSILMSASMLAMLDLIDAIEAGVPIDPKASRREVLGIDIDIRAHNRAAIAAHPMSRYVRMIEGSSVSRETVALARERAAGQERVLVMLDSNHTHEHVLAELEAYAPLVSPGSYCIVFDTIVEELPDGAFPGRPWSRGNSPRTAILEYLQVLVSEGRKAEDGAALHLVVDEGLDGKLLLSAAPGGFLRRV